MTHRIIIIIIVIVIVIVVIIIIIIIIIIINVIFYSIAVFIYLLECDLNSDEDLKDYYNDHMMTGDSCDLNFRILVLYSSKITRKMTTRK